MRRSIPRPTKAQQQRQDAIRELGCIACWMEGKTVKNACGYPTIHHQTRAGFQIGQDATICLASWHHQAIVKDGYTGSKMTAEFGPSLQRGSKPFFAKYGDNAAQLEFQDALLEAAKLRGVA
jgi:hypothetical protein